MTEIAATTESAAVPPGCSLLLYDGECGLCNAVVRFLVRCDRHGRLRFATLQGPAGQRVLRRLGLATRDFDSLVFLPEPAVAADEYQLRTDAVCAVLDRLGGGWRVVAWLRVLPRGWRDAAYRLVARTRYRLFGEYRGPTPPVPEQAERFLG